MWIEARKLDVPVRQALHGGAQVDFLSDLTDEERRLCLQRVHDHFTYHPNLHVGRGGFVEKGKGPDMDAPFSDSSFDYNGVGPTLGKVFRWYRKAVFQDQPMRIKLSLAAPRRAWPHATPPSPGGRLGPWPASTPGPHT